MDIATDRTRRFAGLSGPAVAALAPYVSRAVVRRV
jgi:hypothetical protein